MNVQQGPYGTCPHCNKPTMVRLNSLQGEVTVKEWSCDPKLLKEILKSVAAHAKLGKQAVKKTKDGKTERETIECQLAHCPQCTRPAQRFYWLELDDNLLSDPSCKYCLSQVVRKMEGQDGQAPRVRVYSYTTSVQSVEQAIMVVKQLKEHEMTTEANELF